MVVKYFFNSRRLLNLADSFSAVGVDWYVRGVFIGHGLKNLFSIVSLYSVTRI